MTFRVDAGVAASTMAVQRALAWYGEEVSAARSPPVPADRFRSLRQALEGAVPWQADLFDDLMMLGQAMHRLAGQAPDCNVGDLLTVLSQRLEALPAWPVDPAVDPVAFAKLGFRETSVGISGAQRENREGWWAHGQKNRAFIEQVARDCTGRKLAVALGAGRAFDLPLVELARTFDRLVLVDIDGAALEETVAAVFKDAQLRARVETRVVDLTGVNGTLVRRLDEALTGPGNATEVEERVEALCRSYRLAAPPRILPAGERADLLAASCLLTQLAWPQRTYAERLFEQRFGAMTDKAEARWSTAWAELGLRIQQDHIHALAGSADRIALTSDVVSYPTTLDAGGAERLTGRKILPLGVQTLAERIPKMFRIGRQGSWKWNRYKPVRRGREGSQMDVDGVELQEPVTASGLWLPAGT
jgi:hypothetical protein